MTMTYEETMRYGAVQYADATTALAAAGLPAEFLQTGGMCAALMVTLEAGWYLLVTDLEDTLSWERSEHAGWWVGLYPPEDSRVADGPVRWLESDDGGVPELVRLAEDVLRPR